MKKLLFTLSVILTGCQTMGDHFQCLSEVDKQVPAQTQQRYIRTDTKCNTQDMMASTTKGSQYLGSSTTNCTSTPIYETIVLNQAQRDSVYQQCISKAKNNRNQTNQPALGIPSDCNAYQDQEFVSCMKSKHPSPSGSKLSGYCSQFPLGERRDSCIRNGK